MRAGMFKIDDELKKIPGKPGIYIMKDNNDNILYIGKASILKNRIKQYFQKNSQKSIKTKMLVSKIAAFEYIVSDSESEALVLERNLIQKEKPPYNILLKDDKSFPYIKITVNEKYPRVFITRKLLKDGAKYFGPYTDYPSIKETVKLINKVFPLKRCKKNIDSNYKNTRPCLNYFIDQCLGPCQGNIDRSDYDKVIKDIVLFINGKRQNIIKELQQRMDKFSEELDFEKAVVYRDRINAIMHITHKQKVFNMKSNDSDIIGVATDGITAVVNVFIIRDGKTIGREFFTLSNIKEDSLSQILSSFISQYYDMIHFIPKNIILPELPEDIEMLSTWLDNKKEQKVNISKPVKGEKADYIKMAEKNAELELMRINRDKKQLHIKTKTILEEIKKCLLLERIPERVEAFDISNNKNREKVASMIVYKNGKPYKNDYRRYRIKTVANQDDYASMSEVIFRRYRDKDEDKDKMDRPDIILIDGGKGHVNKVKEVLEFLGVCIPVFGMVKDNKHKTRGIISPEGEIDLTKNMVLFRFFTGVQNEAHRFAMDYNKKLREKSLQKSELDNIKGIGDKRKKALLKTFKSVKRIREASIDELLNVSEINESLAKQIYTYFKRD
jgi:excinuclease ABC subunit C